MNDNEQVSNHLNNLKKQLGIDKLKSNTSIHTNTCEADELTAEELIPISDQSYQPEPDSDYEILTPDNNANTSTAQSVVNLYNGLTRCFNKLVLIPGYSAYAYTHFDSNYNAYLCTRNFNNQFIPFADIKFENSEFVVYQNYQRTGILYGNDNEQVWKFIPNGMPIPNQNPQYIQPNMSNTPTYNYVFNNVPCEQATEIIDFITKNNPVGNVQVNFASP